MKNKISTAGAMPQKCLNCFVPAYRSCCGRASWAGGFGGQGIWTRSWARLHWCGRWRRGKRWRVGSERFCRGRNSFWSFWGDYLLHIVIAYLEKGGAKSFASCPSALNETHGNFPLGPLPRGTCSWSSLATQRCHGHLLQASAALFRLDVAK